MHEMMYLYHAIVPTPAPAPAATSVHPSRARVPAVTTGGHGSVAVGRVGALDARGLAFTLLGWVASPLLGGLTACALAACLERQIFAAPSPALAAHRLRPALLGGTLGLITAFLTTKGPLWLRLPWW
jgi:phosphate/sulfate permease